MQRTMQQIDTVVHLMLENRSLDNLLGMLYSGTLPASVYGADTEPGFKGIPLTVPNYYMPAILGQAQAYYPTNGCGSMSSPSPDPGEEFEHVQNQLYMNGATRSLPDSDNFWSSPPPMSGFVWDYAELLRNDQQVMGCYNASQLPAMYSLAQNYAVSDMWFASVPTQTFANRAFSVCGTSLGKVDNSEITKTTFAKSNTIFNVLAGAGKTWGLYWVKSDASDLASGEPLNDVLINFEPFTPYYFPLLKKAPNGGLHEFNNPKKNDSFMQALAAGTLPNFCFVEPAWGGGIPPIVIQGTDFHPPANVGVCDKALGDLFRAIVASPQWKSMLLIITFDEHGGTYDHVPPPATVAPDNSVPAKSTSQYGFAFQRLGVRIPTLLVSPFVPKGVVFRSPVPDAQFDHTSVIATLCKWAGVDPAGAGLGARVAQAPTFEGVLSLTKARADIPVLAAPTIPLPTVAGRLAPKKPAPEPAAPTAAGRLAPKKPAAKTAAPAAPKSLSLQAPTTPSGKPRTPKAIHFGDLNAAAAASTTPEQFVKRLQALRFPATAKAKPRAKPTAKAPQKKTT